MYKSRNIHTLYSYTYPIGHDKAESIEFMPDPPAGRSCYFTMSFLKYRKTLSLDDKSKWLDIECSMDHTMEVSIEIMAPLGGMSASYAMPI